MTTDSIPTVRVAFQGELGAYGDEAVRWRWRDAAEPLPVRSFGEVVTTVTSGGASYGLVPIWNTLVGHVADGCDAIRVARGRRAALAVVGDVHVVVRHHLLALPGTRLDEVERVASHPVALAQCTRFFDRHRAIRAHPTYDTAGAAKELAAARRPREGALAGRGAAERYGLAILASDVQDVPDNVTHFLVLARTADARRAGEELW